MLATGRAARATRCGRPLRADHRIHPLINRAVFLDRALPQCPLKAIADMFGDARRRVVLGERHGEQSTQTLIGTEGMVGQRPKRGGPDTAAPELRPQPVAVTSAPTRSTSEPGV